MKKALKLLGVGAILVGLLAALILIPKRQELREKAKVPEKTGSLAISPTYDSTQTYVERLEIRFRTGDDQKKAQKVSSLSFRLIYPTIGNSEFVVVGVDNDIQEEIVANKVLENSSEWLFPINRVTGSNGELYIDFAAINTNPSGYTAQDYVNIATIYLQKGTFLKNDLTKLRFDSAKTQMFTKNSPVGNIADLSGEIVY